ncbi:ADP-ribosylation factor-like protein 6 [Nephila pilipes]|uniref:ADP-ribosylation factor-like protein 6 n=1 Tax=Nephila pilipes TaxID=299642 RepID=A0A8X6PDL1_NEPPI|nr:ADP-ribosylation factor-like protein 6 [Nephila pilipes]
MSEFPKDDSLRKKWIKAICKKDFIPSNYSMVSELHFTEDAIFRKTEVYDEKTGIKISVPLKRCRLKSFAVSSIFPNCLKYFSMSLNPAQNCSEQRLKLIENDHLQFLS